MSVSGKHYYRFTYLKSEEWKAVRLAALAKANARCGICKKRDLSNDAHHIRYPENIWETKPRDLVILCRECHDKVHEKYGKEASKKKWRNVKRGVIDHDREEAVKLIEPHCLLCGSTGILAVLKKSAGVRIALCDKCLPGFENSKTKIGGENPFWKALQSEKDKRFQQTSVFLAWRRIIRKFNRKQARKRELIRLELLKYYE